MLHCAGGVDIKSRVDLFSAPWSIPSHSAGELGPCSRELIRPRAAVLEGSECSLSARIRMALGWKNKGHPFAEMSAR